MKHTRVPMWGKKCRWKQYSLIYDKFTCQCKSKKKNRLTAMFISCVIHTTDDITVSHFSFKLVSRVHEPKICKLAFSLVYLTSFSIAQTVGFRIINFHVYFVAPFGSDCVAPFICTKKREKKTEAFTREQQNRTRENNWKLIDNFLQN